MATGDILEASSAYGDTAQPRVVPFVTTIPEDAASVALAAYLRRARFYVPAGAPPHGEVSRVREFALNAVSEEWPSPTNRLDYPAASIIGAGLVPYEGAFTPSPIPGTEDLQRGTVLWKVGVAAGELQVDFWSIKRIERNAIGAQVAGLFNPRESRSGLLLEAPPEYACAPIRFLLQSTETIDTPDTVYANERRFQAMVAWDCTLLEMRRYVQISPRTKTEVCEPGSD